MIINGQAVKGAKRLANHLLKSENERVQVLEISGVASNDNLHQALRDMEIVGDLTKTRTGKVLYHANINPKKNERLTPEDYIKASDRLMKELGFTDQPRAIVMHQKQGRQHAHLVVQLTDVEKMKLRPISNNYYKHRAVARELEKTFGLEKTPGLHTGKSYSQAEAQQTKKTGYTVKDLRHIVQRIYKHAKDGKTFQQGLNRWGMMMAQGKRIVLLDKNGTPHSLTRMLKSVAQAREMKEKVADIAKALPTIEQGQNSLDIQRRKEIDLSKDQERFKDRLEAGKGYLELSATQERLLKQKRDRGYSL
ncbi:MAG: hypothetical protein Roseis2KO_53730 [Roseivirga sp.]